MQAPGELSSLPTRTALFSCLLRSPPPPIPKHKNNTNWMLLFQKLAKMEDTARKRGIRSNAERRLFHHEAWPGLMKLLRQTTENMEGVSIKHPKLVGGEMGECVRTWRGSGGCCCFCCSVDICFVVVFVVSGGNG